MEVIEEIEGRTLIGFVSATDMDDGNIIYYYIVGEFTLTVFDRYADSLNSPDTRLFICILEFEITTNISMFWWKYQNNWKFQLFHIEES